MRRIVGRALLLTLVCVVTACGGEGIAERIIEESASSGGGGDVDVDIDEDDGTITVESEEGSASFSSGSQEMPDGFPFPCRTAARF